MTLVEQIQQMSPEELKAYEKALTKKVAIRTAVLVTTTVIVHVGLDLLMRRLSKNAEITTN